MTGAVISFVSAVAANPKIEQAELEGLVTAEPGPNREGETTTGPVNADNSDTWLYRDRTIGLLKRYMRLSVEVGRLPSLLGREFFRTRVTSYSVSTFEDTVIFVHDVERSLEKLNPFDQSLIAKIVLMEYSQREAGRILNCGLRSIERFFPEAIDRLSGIFLSGGILTPLIETEPRPKKTCQEGENDEILASCCNDCEKKYQKAGGFTPPDLLF
jgi:hypothetical protein